MTPIDVWDASTLDDELVARLEGNAALLSSYFERDHQIFLSHDLGRGPDRSILRPDNIYAADFLALQTEIAGIMSARVIRAFHYSRLREEEVEGLLANGVRLSTPQFLQTRLDAAVDANALTKTDARKLYAESPFHSDQLEARSGKFWMASHPIAKDDSGVAPLLERWGGEVAAMWINDSSLVARLQSLGSPRVVELAVPLVATRHCWEAGKAVMASFARSRGAIPGKFAFDLYTERDLSASAILAVHSENSASFIGIGKSYPPGFVDVDIGRWKELTGEDD